MLEALCAALPMVLWLIRLISADEVYYTHISDLEAIQLILMPNPLIGSKPGLLDATQPGRLLRDSGSSLLFATLDPRTATAHTNALNSSSRSGKYKFSSRIVIEKMPDGEAFWRFVPISDLAIGISNEGQWPRLVSFCGYAPYLVSSSSTKPT